MSQDVWCVLRYSRKCNAQISRIILSPDRCDGCTSGRMTITSELHLTAGGSLREMKTQDWLIIEVFTFKKVKYDKRAYFSSSQKVKDIYIFRVRTSRMNYNNNLHSEFVLCFFVPGSLHFPACTGDRKAVLIGGMAPHRGYQTTKERGSPVKTQSSSVMPDRKRHEMSSPCFEEKKRRREKKDLSGHMQILSLVVFLPDVSAHFSLSLSGYLVANHKISQSTLRECQRKQLHTDQRRKKSVWESVSWELFMWKTLSYKYIQDILYLGQ